MPVKGDHSDREILRYRRIRVERQEVLPGDTAPMLCGHGPILLLSGRDGLLARSTNGGVTWERLGSLREHAGSNGHVLTLAELAPDRVLAALCHQGAITVLSSGDFGETWQAGGRIASGAEAAAGPARFEAQPGGPLCLWMGRTAYRSSDGGSTWAAGETPSGAGPDEREGVRERGGRITLPDGRVVLTYAEPCYPYGARAVVSADGGATWGDEVFVLGHARAATNTVQPRPLRSDPGAGAVSVALDDGTVVSAYDRGAAIPPAMAPMDGRRMDESSHGPAIVVARWTPEGLRRPPLVYPNLSTDRVNARGYGPVTARRPVRRRRLHRGLRDDRVPAAAPPSSCRRRRHQGCGPGRHPGLRQGDYIEKCHAPRSRGRPVAALGGSLVTDPEPVRPVDRASTLGRHGDRTEEALC